MAEQIAASSIAAPGFAGLNTQDSPTQLDSGFASQAMNCVIDKFGRIGARKGWSKVNATNTDLGSANVQFMFEMSTGSGEEFISAGNNKLFVGTTTLVQKLVRNADNSGNATYTITDSNWQGAAIPYGEEAAAKPHAYLVQVGHEPLVYHELPLSGGVGHAHNSGTYGFQKFADVGTLPPGYSSTDFKPNCALAAYGRIWMADIAGDKQTVYFSRLLDGSDFSGGDSGSLALSTVFPNNDEIVAMGAHNGFLVIFGRNNIAIYANPIDVTTLALAEFIPNVGCVARDTVMSTGSDIMFLSDGGIRSLGRVVQEKSLPFRDISINVRDDLMQKVNSETVKNNIKGIYSEKNAFYLLALPTVKEVYCFDTRGALQNGALRTTIWNKIEPKCFLIDSNKDLYIGKPGYIGKYGTYRDDTSTYRMVYFTNYFDIGQPTVEKILKKINWIVIGGSNQAIVTKWGFEYTESFRSDTITLAQSDVSEYNIAQYNIDEFAPGVVIAKVTKQVGGAGAVIQLGLETEINQNPFSIQKINVFCKLGKNV